MEEVKEHPFFADVNWDDVLNKRIPPPIEINVRQSNFDRQYT